MVDAIGHCGGVDGNLFQANLTTKWCDGDYVDTTFEDHVSCSQPLIQLSSSRYIKATHASYFVTACDLVCSLLFLACWAYLYRHLTRLSAAGNTGAVSPLCSDQDLMHHP